MIPTHRLSAGLLTVLTAALLALLTGCGGASSSPPLSLSSTRPSLLFFYVEG